MRLLLLSLYSLSAYFLSSHLVYVVMAAPLAVDNPNTGSLAHLEAPRTLPTAHSITPPLYLERFVSRPSTFPIILLCIGDCGSGVTCACCPF
ncbi:hypothetical protein C8R42DRAFT_686030 [Lentinula raphanica]|nr:hypothetical protein C8R42DRAFT_686030 [Lentinula raphanica]